MLPVSLRLGSRGPWRVWKTGTITLSIGGNFQLLRWIFLTWKDGIRGVSQSLFSLRFDLGERRTKCNWTSVGEQITMIIHSSQKPLSLHIPRAALKVIQICSWLSITTGCWLDRLLHKAHLANWAPRYKIAWQNGVKKDLARFPKCFGEKNETGFAGLSTTDTDGQ